jgi:hypothetical protein
LYVLPQERKDQFFDAPRVVEVWVNRAVVGGEEVLDDHLFVWNALKVGGSHRPIGVDAEDRFGAIGVQLGGATCRAPR